MSIAVLIRLLFALIVIYICVVICIFFSRRETDMHIHVDPFSYLRSL